MLHYIIYNIKEKYTKKICCCVQYDGVAIKAQCPVIVMKILDAVLVQLLQSLSAPLWTTITLNLKRDWSLKSRFS
ncbi:unnamed protein product [Parnassius mnemosyne]|uniref:Uncharacterized protein n=1 Tax=Parnassius mnemosyne TaxID=213953 RepID=A0AAV1KWS9_9NEOP